MSAPEGTITAEGTAAAVSDSVTGKKGFKSGERPAKTCTEGDDENELRATRPIEEQAAISPIDSV